MAFFKIADSNFQNQVIDIIHDKQNCDNCNNKLDLLHTNNGKVKCSKCGHENVVSEMN